MRVPFEGGRARKEVRQLLRDLGLHTVCESARCPNLCECWKKKSATFMLLGETCTRNCRFCAVNSGVPSPPDPGEPARVAEAVSLLGLRYSVLTCVTRDDLADGGAAHIAEAVCQIRSRNAGVRVEVLPSDFGGDLAAVDTVLAAVPNVFNHNLETIRRLTSAIRSGADYDRSLSVLKYVAEHGTCRVKSGIMLGLGETPDEVWQCLQDLRSSGVTILTMGQYLPPSPDHWPLDRYVSPEEFSVWKRRAKEELGFTAVVSGPLVRSSYKAEEAGTISSGEGQ